MRFYKTKDKHDLWELVYINGKNDKLNVIVRKYVGNCFDKKDLEDLFIKCGMIRIWELWEWQKYEPRFTKVELQ